ncbi:MAG: NAD+ synthase [Actinomycetota bacterium]|nr:NAD+ synthase [Actinomycetota bacterium]
MRTLRVAGAQLKMVVGDLVGNRDRILEAMRWAEGVQADVLLLPELALPGYPPEDLVLKEAFLSENLAVLQEAAARAGEVVTVVGFVDRAEERPALLLDDAMELQTANAAALLYRGEVRGVYHKVLLPNYGVFDEDRYFVAGREPGALWRIGGVAVGVSICEDIWVPGHGPPLMQAQAGAEILLNINASPYHRGKGAERQRLLAGQARAAGVPVVYLNLVGGQDELVFDGQSMVLSAEGELLFRAEQFEEQCFCVDVPLQQGRPAPGRPVRSRPLADRELRPVPRWGSLPDSEEEEIYAALVTGLGDYVRKNGFSHVVVALSGGIDSALTATLAADALGPDAVWGVNMPSRFSSPASLADAQEFANRVGCRFDVIPIDDIFSSHLEALGPHFKGTEPGTAEENLQARIRGTILMALSNKLGGMVLATGNKSEMAVGYATLYGDMAGGFAVLKDVFKTRIYRLAQWRNRHEEVIPRSIIEKAPSAELRPNQLDTDSLPPYGLLDPILEHYVEHDRSVAEIVQAGFDPEVVRRVVRMVDRNEYKRRQGPPGVKITRKAFGRDRRLPITNWYRE